MITAMLLDSYKAAFAKLRSDAVPSRWTPATNNRAPHKPFLLLSILDLIAQGQITTNLIRLNAELIDTFGLYWASVMGVDREGSAVLPFYHLKSDDFWHLVPRPGQEETIQVSGPLRTFRQLDGVVLGASFDEALFDLLLQAEPRDSLRRILIEQYFSPDTRAKVVEIGQISAESFEYSRELLDRLRGTFKLKEAPEVDAQYRTESRSTAFRRVVVQAYHHTCALCRVRVLTPEGYTAVAAAHIVPWSVSHNDDPRNGLALCGFHHWAFDKGVVGITTDYTIIVSPILKEDEQGVAPLVSLAGQSIYLPLDSILWPAKRALSWHRAEIFRAEAPQTLL